jgi:epoxyqueuosine reductase QueG
MSTSWEHLEQLAQRKGVEILAAADVGPLPAALRQDLPRAVSLGKVLDAQIAGGIADGPTEAYCREYDRVNDLLTETAREAARILTDLGARAVAIEASEALEGERKRKLAASFPHKAAATLAGLGWIGKCNLLITEEYGSAVRWATVLTDADLPVGEAVVESRCGQCGACVEICPGQACRDVLWRQGMKRDEVWDAWACLAGIKNICAGRDISRTICGMCIAACPYTQKYVQRS